MYVPGVRGDGQYSDLMVDGNVTAGRNRPVAPTTHNA